VVIYLRLDRRVSESGCPAPALVARRGGQQVFVAGLVIRHGAQETAQRGGTDFNAVQVVVKACQGFHEVADDLILGMLHATGGRPIVPVICCVLFSQDHSLSVLWG
jgi:hypothetical protein